MDITADTYECFGHDDGPRPHFKAAKKLYQKGAWIGYLRDHKKSFKTLPSFSDLLRNCKNFMTPYPEPLTGVCGEERHAACRGCFAQKNNIRYLTLSELPFTEKRKVIILPLSDDKGKEELFSILVPIKLTRAPVEGSHLSAYSPWGVENGGHAINRFVLIAPRNSSAPKGTLNALHEALRVRSNNSEDQTEAYEINGTSETPDTSRRASGSSFAALPNGSTSAGSSIRRETRNMRLSASRDTDEPEGQADATPQDDVQQSGRRSRRGRPSKGDTPAASPTDAPLARVMDVAPSTPEDAAANKRKKLTPNQADAPSAKKQKARSVDRDAAVTGATPNGTSDTPNETPRPSQTPLPIGSAAASPTPFVQRRTNLTEDQARNVSFTWQVAEEDEAVDHVHSLYECPSLDELFTSFSEDVEFDKNARRIFETTKIWRASYQFPGQPAKGINLRAGNEAAFERLKDTIARANFWREMPDTQLNVELKPL